jgi:tetratricopeptide (TPR) repeat protein
MKNEEKTGRYQALAEECLKAKRFEEAITFYQRLIELNPGDDSFRLCLGWAYHDSGRQEQAVACFEQIFEKELRGRVFTGFAFDELVRIFKENKWYDRLVAMCERAAAAQPEDIALLGELGDAYLSAGRFKDAVGIFERMTAMEPDASAFFCSLGQARILNHDHAGGKAAYHQAVAIDPEKAGVFFGRMAHVYEDAGLLQESEEALRQGLAEHGSDLALLMGLGDILIRQGKPEDGLAVYERIMELQPNTAGVYLNRLGRTLARSRYHREAIEVLNRAIALDAQNPFHYIALSDCYLSLGDEDAAADALRRARP